MPVEQVYYCALRQRKFIYLLAYGTNGLVPTENKKQ